LKSKPAGLTFQVKNMRGRTKSLEKKKGTIAGTVRPGDSRNKANVDRQCHWMSGMLKSSTPSVKKELRASWQETGF